MVHAPVTTPHSRSSSCTPFEVAAVTFTAMTAPDVMSPSIFPRDISSSFPNAITTRQKANGSETRDSNSGNRGV
jgi:hypothetical protein